MKKKLMAVMSMALVLACTACAETNTAGSVPVDNEEQVSAEQIIAELPQETSDEAAKAESSEGDNDTDSLVAEQTPSGYELVGEALSEEELTEISEKISSAEYNGFLTTAYETAEDIDWTRVLYCGADIGAINEASDEEVAAYLETAGTEEYGDILSIKRADLEAYVQKHTKTDYKSAKNPYKGTYVEAYDTYYVQRSEGYLYNYKCLEGAKDGPVYTVIVENTEYGSYDKRSEFCFEKEGDTLVVRSNRILWEEQAKSRFDVAFTQYGDSKCEIYCYENGYVLLVVDGNSKDHVFAEYDSKRMEVKAVASFDVNGDGYEDLVLIGSADDCDHVNIFKYDEKRVGLFPDEECDLEIDGKLGTSIDMDSVKALIET